MVWLLGLLIVLAAVYVLYTTTDLREIVPEGVVIAIILLVLGIGAVSYTHLTLPTKRIV